MKIHIQKVLLFSKRENYLFSCECARCVTELSTQEDVTSDEDLEEDDEDSDDYEDIDDDDVEEDDDGVENKEEKMEN